MLPNGLALLGDVRKWAPMSYRRVRSLVATNSTVAADIIGAPLETVPISYVTASSLVVEEVSCTFPAAASAACDSPDQHSDVDCAMKLTCTHDTCSCAL